MLLAAHQPHYLPYPGLLAKIDAADVFVMQDDLQYVKQEWQNRNRIRTRDGWRWLTVPVTASSRSRIADVMPAGRTWLREHQRLVAAHYPRAVLPRIDPVWRAIQGVSAQSLAQINAMGLQALLQLLDIRTPIVTESALGLSAEECATKDGRLIALCRRLGCDAYLSGSGARDYLRPERWLAAGIDLRMLEWQALPYQQWHPGWVPNLSTIDLLMCADDPRQALRRDRLIVEMAAAAS
jgi:hypothetical protein